MNPRGYVKMPNEFKVAEGKRIKITKQQQRRIERLYEDVLRDMKKETEKLRNRTNISSILRTQLAKGIARETKYELNLLSGKLETDIKNQMLTMSVEVVLNNQKMLAKMGFPQIYASTAYSYLPRDVVQELISGKLYEGRWSLSKAIWSDSKKALQDIDFIVAKGVAENKSAYDIAKDLEVYVNPDVRKDWEWSKAYPGTKKKIDYNAQRLARTMISHAYEESFVRTTKNNPFVEYYKWLMSNSDRVCPVCIARATDNQYGLGSGIYPKDELPLDHPNGMCTFETVISKSYSQIAKDIKNWSENKGDKNLNKQLDIFAKELYGL